MASGKTLQSTIEISGVLSPSLQAAINSAVDKLAEMSEETLESADAASRLAAEMSVQEDVLKTLKKAYAGYAVNGEESSEQARELADKIQTVSAELDDNRGSMKAAEKAVAKLTGKQEDAADAFKTLEKKIGSQEDELSALRRQYANVALEQGETSDEAKKLASKITSLSGDLNKNKQALKAAESAADSLGSALEDAGEDAENSSSGYTVLKDVIADLASTALTSATEAFKELATEGDNALAMLNAKTGASASEMEGFEDVMYEVYNANYGESLGDVSDTLSTVIQMTDDLDNASLAKVTKSAIALDDVFGFDTVESMRAVNSLMDKFGITSEGAFNLVVQGAQEGLNQNDDLLDTINEYSVHFSQLGFSADDMFNVLASGAESGTFSVDKLGDAVKEFGIRAIDDSDSTAKAFKDLGLDVEDMEDKFTAGGDSAAEAFKLTLERLGEVDNEVWKNQIGVALFGTMWEDLGEDTILALGKTEGALSSTSDAMEKMDSAAYDTLESSLSQLGRTVKAEVVQPIAKKLTPVLKNTVKFVTSKVGPTVDWLLDHLPEIGVALGVVGAAIVALKWGSIVAQISKVSGSIAGLVAKFGTISGPVLAVIGVIAALAAGFMYLWNTNDGFRESMTTTWQGLQTTFSELGGTISAMIEQLAPIIATIITTVLEAFGQIAVVVIPILVQLISEILPVIIQLMNLLLPVFVQIVQAILPVLVQLIQTLLPVFMQIVQTVLPVLVQLINLLLPVFMQIVQMILPVLVQLVTSLMPIITMIINAVLPVLVQILNMLTPLLSMIISLLSPILTLIITLVTPILNLIMMAITPLINIFTSLINMVLVPIIPIFTAVATVITTVLATAIQSLSPIITAIQGVFSGLITFITGVFSGNWSTAWSGVVQTFSSIWDGLVALVKVPINGVIGLVNGAINAINGISIDIPDWVPGLGGSTFGVSIPTIPLLASGGFTDGVSIAGEEGMEAVISFDPAYHAKNVGIWERAGQLLGVLGSENEGAGLTRKAGELLKLDDFSLGSLVDGTNVVIYYDFSGFTWSPQIHTDGSGEDEDDFMARLKAHEAEFFEWLAEFIRMREAAQYA